MFSICSNLCIKLWKKEWNPEGVSNIKPFINKYNCDGIKYLSKLDDWKTFEENNPTIALNVLYFKGMEF